MALHNKKPEEPSGSVTPREDKAPPRTKGRSKTLNRPKTSGSLTRQVDAAEIRDIKARGMGLPTGSLKERLDEEEKAMETDELTETREPAGDPFVEREQQKWTEDENEAFRSTKPVRSTEGYRHSAPSGSKEGQATDVEPVKLASEKCAACDKNSPHATEQDISELKPQIPDWSLASEEGIRKLQRVFRFNDFAEALAFTNKIGDLAESGGHHPSIITEWGKVTLKWWTTAIRDLHRNDFIMAAKSDLIYSYH